MKYGRHLWVRVTTALQLPFTQTPMRARVHKVSIVAGGEVSVVLRFGIDEPRARTLNQGALLDVVPHTAGKLAAAMRADDERKRGAPAVLEEKP